MKDGKRNWWQIGRLGLLASERDKLIYYQLKLWRKRQREEVNRKRERENGTNHQTVCVDTLIYAHCHVYQLTYSSLIYSESTTAAEAAAPQTCVCNRVRPSSHSNWPGREGELVDRPLSPLTPPPPREAEEGASYSPLIRMDVGWTWTRKKRI